MLEKDFQIKWKHALDHCFSLDAKYEYHKLSDMSINRKPYDCYIVSSEGFHAFELKIVHTKKLWNIARSFKGRKHQLKSLMIADFPNINNYGFVVLYFDVLKRCFCIPIWFVKEYEGAIVNPKIEDLERFELNKIKIQTRKSCPLKYVYDITPIL